jgi:hypothetical protein
MVKIDGKKLHAKIREKDLNMSKVSEENGYSIGWIGSAIKRNVASPALLVVLERYGITFDDIKPDDAEEVKEVRNVPENAICNMTSDELYRVIYAAVVNALDGTDNRRGVVQ